MCILLSGKYEEVGAVQLHSSPYALRPSQMCEVGYQCHPL